MPLDNSLVKNYVAHWEAATGCDHWHCLKMALDDLKCEGFLARQR